eukprot:TRINITY_DN330_c1_g1_i1.p1 TRINITY_DN330_c1_g1~~TRINITY_DN330_c1_g1_i1.p1  ORF type:complete len:885 (-),score=219.35 TRINITY_DN330_c1_g1_i1:224-2608(-)
MYQLFKRMQQLTGIKLTKRAMEELRLNPSTFRVVLPDIKKVTARVKHMNVVSVAEAKALSIHAMRSEIHHSGERLFNLAKSKFERAYRATPDNTTILNDFARMLWSYAFKEEGRPMFECLSQAFEKLCMAKNYRAICDMTDELLERLPSRMLERAELLQLAHECFSYIERNGAASPEWLLKWGDVLLERAHMKHSDEGYAEAGKHFREAIEAGVVHPFHVGLVDTLDDRDLAVMLEVHRHGEAGRQEGTAIDANALYSRRLVSYPVLTKCATILNVHTLVLDECDHLFREQSGVSLKMVLERAAGKLRHLSLARNPSLSSRILRNALSVLHALHSLNLHACYQAFGSGCCHILVREKPQEKAWWRKLQRLDLSDTPVEDAFVERVAEECQLLERIDLSYTYVSSLALEKVMQQCTRMQELVLDGCAGLADDVMEGLYGLTRLSHLSVGGCLSLSLAGVQVLADLPTRLRSVDLSCCPLNSFVIDALATHPLGELSLRGCSTLDDDELMTLTKGLSLRLHTLQIGYCDNISSVAISSLIESQDALTRISVAGCQSVDSAVIEAICGHASSLSSLSLHGCYRTGANSLKQLAVCTALTKLNLNSVHRKKYDCPHVPLDNVLASIAPSLTRLSKLGIRRTNVSNIGVEHLLEHCKLLQELDLAHSEVTLGKNSVRGWPASVRHLRELSLAGCRFVTFPPRDGSISLEGLCELRQLNISNCRNVNRQFVEYLSQHGGVLPALEVLVVGPCSQVNESGFDVLRGTREMLQVDYRRAPRQSEQSVSSDIERKPWKTSSLN